MEHTAVMRRTQNRLARGRQVRVERRREGPVLVHAAGTVLLNEGAAALLDLCDGTRTLEEIVTEYLSHAANHQLEADVREFLEAARQRGWIVEV